MAQNSTDNPDITVLIKVEPIPRVGGAFSVSYSTSTDGKTPEPGSNFDPTKIKMNCTGKITFAIDGTGMAGWTFPDGGPAHSVMPGIPTIGPTTTDYFYGVTIETPGSDATLSGFGRSADKTSVWVTDAATTTQSRSYLVTVINLALNESASLDPTIKDQAT